jgi:hypothetical protein
MGLEFRSDGARVVYGVLKVRPALIVIVIGGYDQGVGLTCGERIGEIGSSFQ